MQTRMLPPTGVLALLLVVALKATAASPQVPQTTDGKEVPLSLSSLLTVYLAGNPSLRTDPAFARDWTIIHQCAAWTRLANDEFRAAPFLKAGAAELAGGREPAPQSFEVRFSRNMGRYDAAKQEYALPTLGGSDVLPMRISGFNGEQGQSAFGYACSPESGKYPVEFTVAFANPEVANGLPMAAAAAEAFATSRTNQNGSRETGVGVTLKLTMALGAPHAVNPPYVAKGVVVPVSAHIDDVIVDDGTPRHAVIYRLDDAKRQSGETAAAQVRHQAQVEAAVKPLDAATLAAQFKSEMAGAKVGDQSARIQLNTSWTLQGAPGAQKYRFDLKPTDAFDLGGVASLRFENAAEVAALAPTPELRAVLEKARPQAVFVTYVPVGASDDMLKGGATVMGHVLSVDALDLSTGSRRLFSVPTTSTPVPWSLKVDGRTAAAFDVLGIKVGMGVDEVTSLAGAALGQKLAFDSAKGDLHSPVDDCDFDRVRGRAPPLGRRCLAATFMRQGASAPWLLVGLRLKQTAAASTARAVANAVSEKYGAPDLVMQFDPPATLYDMEETERSATAVGWGVRLSNRRAVPDHVPFPLHAFEMISQVVGDQLTTTLTLTDEASITAAVDAEAAAKRAAEGVATKF